VTTPPGATAHPDFAALAPSYELALQADGYAANTVISYQRAVAGFGAWLAEHHPGVGPDDADRDHVRGWIVHVRDTASSGTARSWFAGLRHFFRWMVAEGDRDTDPTEGIKTPKPNDVQTPIVAAQQVKALLGTCSGNGFVPRRDAAILYAFLDCGLRLAEVAGLTVDDVDIRDRVLFVEGKGTNRSGPRRRAAPLGVNAARAFDRYLRERRKHPHAERPQLWLGDRGRANLSPDGIDAMLKRRGALVGIVGLHPHMFRHTWASAFRERGGSEGDLMYLGGWRSRTMLDRYGRVVAGERAKEAGRRLSLGDSL
jgi:site-specific recombinase XerD